MVNMGMNQIESNEIRLDQVRSDKNDKIDSNLDQPWWLPLVISIILSNTSSTSILSPLLCTNSHSSLGPPTQCFSAL